MPLPPGGDEAPAQLRSEEGAQQARWWQQAPVAAGRRQWQQHPVIF